MNAAGVGDGGDRLLVGVQRIEGTMLEQEKEKEQEEWLCIKA